jgi:hypothetical protein
MKAVFCGILGVLAAFALAGCGKGGYPQASGVAAGTSDGTTVVATTPAEEIHTLEASVLASAKPTGQPCSLDSIDGNYSKQVHVTAGKPHVFRGWLLNASRQPACKLNLILEGKQNYAIPAVTGVARPDVGDYLTNPALAQAGFEFSSALQDVAPGQYTLLLMIRGQHRALICQLAKDVVIEIRR